ncbi:MAG TPA: hypothetical protein VNV66_06960 [Pilimelia sp.]|nr:hypothetical protein [Pilimelia sp.]
MTYPPQPGHGHWDVPPPPGRPTAVRGGRITAGIGIALGAHLLTISVLLLGLLLQDPDLAGEVGLPVMLIGQAVVFLACLTVGIILTARQDGGVGIGLLIGWAVGVVAAPVVGFGVCVWAISRSGL